MAIPFYSEMQLNKNPLKGLVVESSNVAPSNPVAGQIYRNSSDNLMYWYNGSEWTTFGSGSGGGAGSTIYYGEWTYDNTYVIKVTIPDFTLEDGIILMLRLNYVSPLTNSIEINSGTGITASFTSATDNTMSKYYLILTKYNSTLTQFEEIGSTVFYDTDTHNLLSADMQGDLTPKSGLTLSDGDLIFTTFSNWELTTLSAISTDSLIVSSGMRIYKNANELAIFGETGNMAANIKSNMLDAYVACYIRGHINEQYDNDMGFSYITFTPAPVSQQRSIVSDFEPGYDYWYIGISVDNSKIILYPDHPIYRVNSQGFISIYGGSNTATKDDLKALITNMPSTIAEWTITGTTPTSSALNTFMANYETTIQNYLNNGTLLKYTYTDGNNNVVTYFFNVNYSTDGAGYSYDFDCHNDNSKSFYIYYGGSTFYWNTEPGACFIGTTIVHTENGMKYIKDINVGDKVLSFNFNTGREEYKEVNNIVAHKVGTIYRVELDDDILQCTYDEPFIMKDKNKVQAQFLHMYDKLYSTSRKEQIIQRITTKIDQSEMVYDLSVKDNYNYLVGKNKIVVATENITKI